MNNKNVVESLPYDIAEQESLPGKNIEKEEKIDFSQERLRVVNLIEKQKDLLLGFFNQYKKADEQTIDSVDELNIDVINFNEIQLLKDGLDTYRLLRLLSLQQDNLDNDNPSLNMEEVLKLVHELEEIKNKLEVFRKLAGDKISQIIAGTEKLVNEKSDLEKSLSEIKKQFFAIKLFKKSEINELEKNILDLDNKILDQKNTEKQIREKVDNFFLFNGRSDGFNAEEILIKGYLTNVKNEIKDLESLFLSQEVIEKIGNDYISDKVLPYLFDSNGNTEYVSDMDAISQEDKDIYLEVYKKNLSLERGAHARTYDLTPEEKKEHDNNIKIFEKVQHKLNKTYLGRLKLDSHRFELYQSQTNSSFNDECKSLVKIVFSELYDLEVEKCYREAQNNLDDESESNFRLNVFRSFSVNTGDFKNVGVMYPRIKELIFGSNIIKEDVVDEIEYSLIQKLYNQHVLNEHHQGGEGQKAFMIMDVLDNKKAVPYYLQYIKNNEYGHTHNTATYFFIKAVKNLSDNGKEDVYKNLKEEDKYFFDRVTDKNSYLYKIIHADDFNNSAQYLISRFSKDFRVFDLQEKIAEFLEKSEKSQEDILSFYKFMGNNSVDNILKYIEFSGENKEEVLKIYQQNFLKNNDFPNNIVEVTKLLQNYQELFELILEKKKYDLLFCDQEMLKAFNYEEVCSRLIELEEGNVLVSNLDKFQNLNHQEIVNKLIEAGQGESVAENLGKFQDLNQEIASKLIEIGKENSVAENLDKFQNLDRDFGKKLLDSLKNFNSAIRVNDYFNPPLDKMLDKTSEIFGTFANIDNYNLIKGINNEDGDILRGLKIKKGGNDGLRELQEILVSFKKEMISEDFDPEIFFQEYNYSLYLPYFKSYIRYQEANWGAKDDENFNNIIKKYNDYKNKGELQQLNSNFTSSPELLIAKSDSKAQEGHKFNEHFLNRFSVLVRSLKKSKELYQEKFPLDNLVKQIEQKRELLIAELKEKALGMPNLRAKEGIEQKISSLEAVSVRSLKDFQDNFSVLAKNKEFNELLRQTVFVYSFSKNRQSLDFDLEAIDLNRPKVDDMSWVLNFVDHITNQETMSKYFTDKKSQNMFNEVVSAQAISEEMALLQNMGGQSKDTTKIQLIPTRGVLTEFSGHIADACWASKYESILKSFPNFTSVVIRQNPETKFERLAGALMLIETESKDGERLLVVRGFNPIENLINSLSVKDFYDQVMEYLQDLAKKDNRKLAVVIDDHAGGAATNRPLLFNHLSVLSKSLKAIDLKSEDDTTFNGYNIVRKAYLVD